MVIMGITIMVMIIMVMIIMVMIMMVMIIMVMVMVTGSTCREQVHSGLQSAVYMFRTNYKLQY